MKPAARLPSTAFTSGFTLLEISIVLVIASMLVGLGAVMAGSLMSENELQKAVTQIETMGVEAVRRASSTRRQQVILFHEDRCELMDESGELVRTVKLPASGKLTLQQYYAKDLDDAAGQSLRVLPGCLLLPCRLVLSAAGGAYEFVLDPLTGGYRPE